MSASDKKKQRKAAMAEGLTQKQLAEQAAEKAAKQKRIAYIAVGVACAAAAAALLAWNGISSFVDDSKKDQVAVVIDGENYSVADMRYYYNQARNNYYSYYSQFSAYGLDSFDPNISDGAQWYNESEGITYADYFRESAVNTLKQTVAICKEAKKDGYSLSADGEKTVDSQLAEIDRARAAYGITRKTFFNQQYGIGEKDFIRNLSNDILASEYAQYYQDNVKYEDTDLDAYYEANKNELDGYTYRSFFISGAAPTPVDENGDPIVDETGETVEPSDEAKAAAMAEAKEKAEAAKAEIQGAADIEAAFIETAPKYVSESTVASYEDPNYSLSSNVLGSTLRNGGSAYYSWLTDETRKNGDVDVVEAAGNGYYVVMFKSRKLDDDPTVDVRHVLIAFETSEDDEVDENGRAIPSQAEKDAAKAKAQSVLDEFNSGDKTPDSFGALADEYSEDGRDEHGHLNAAGGKYAAVRKGYMVQPFNDWIFDPARKSGDTGLVETTYGWHVMYFEGLNDPAWRLQAISSKQDSEFNDWVDALVDSLSVTEADGMELVGAANTAAAGQ